MRHKKRLILLFLTSFVLVMFVVQPVRMATALYWLFRYGSSALEVVAQAALGVREQDGTPNVANVTEIRVSNGTLTNNGAGSVSITTGGGGGTSVGDAGDIQLTDGAGAFDNLAGLNVVNGQVNSPSGYASACAPGTDADRCDNRDVDDSQAPDAGPTNTCDWKFNGGTLQYICVSNGNTLQTVARQALALVGTSDTVTLTDYQCQSDDIRILNTDTGDALTINLCASPTAGITKVCVANASGSAEAITTNGNGTDTITYDGADLDPLVCGADDTVDFCLIATSASNWRYLPGVGTCN